jgi:hypothetical protein
MSLPAGIGAVLEGVCPTGFFGCWLELLVPLNDERLLASECWPLDSGALLDIYKLKNDVSKLSLLLLN